MTFDIVTIFPAMIEQPLAAGIVGRAIERGTLDVKVRDLRDFTTDRHRIVDDVPYGGGAGMVMKPEPLVLAIEADGTSYRQSGSVRDRDRLRSEHLQRLGWRFHRIWSTNWFRDPQSEVAKLQQAYDEAVSATVLPKPEAAAEAEQPQPEAVAKTVLPQPEAAPGTAKPWPDPAPGHAQSQPDVAPGTAQPRPEMAPGTAKPPLETARAPDRTQIVQPEVRRPLALPPGS